MTLALFIALVWRSFWIPQLASRAGLRFGLPRAGFGLWAGRAGAHQYRRNMGVAHHG
jgi:hypothetical protein